MSENGLNLESLSSAFEKHNDLIPADLAAGILTGVSLLPLAVTPSEWFDLLWVGDEPTVSEAAELGEAFERAVDWVETSRAYSANTLLSSLGEADIKMFSMGIAMALNWGKVLWSEIGVVDGSDEDHLIGALLLVCITLAWPEEHRPNDDRLPSFDTARAQLETAIDAVSQISKQANTSEVTH